MNLDKPFFIRVATTQEDYKACEKILRSLPDWFGIESAIVDYANEIPSLHTYLAELEGEIVAFCSIKFHNEFSAEVYVMGIMPSCHRKGIGRKLVVESEKYLKEHNFEYLQVKTLSPAHPDKNYALTRKFYLSVGFRPLEELKELWGSANPCLLMIKKL